MKLRSTLILLAILFSFQSQATHVTGSVITYKAIDTFKYEISVVYYRDCYGVPFGNPSNGTKIKCLSGGTASVSLSLMSIEDVSQIVDTANSGCSPSNTFGTGLGIEKHTYSGIIDFNSAPYLSLKNCCEVVIESGQCCRPSAINTGPANSNFYNYAYINLCETNNNTSAVISSEPINYFCCNQPVFMNLGAIDTVDYDSLSYSWGSPLRGWSQNVSYSGTNYAYDHPFKAYYPGSLAPPYKNPNAYPPVGLYLNAETGDVVFTPTRCDEVTVAVIEVREWRKDSSGTPQVVGVTRFDHMYWTQDCPANNPPEIDGPYSYNVCEGETLCFDITTDDAVYVPPPPNPTPQPDSVSIRWNHAIPGATFTVLNPSARLQTGRFCWTPTNADTGNSPHMFVVTARDNAFPLNGVTKRSFTINVNPKPAAEVAIEELNCNEFELGVNHTGSNVKMNILDTAFNLILNSSKARWNSTGTFLSTQEQDTLLFDSVGTFLIEITIENTYDCSIMFYDTVVVQSVNVPAAPVITKSGEMLYSSISGVQWYLNDTILPGAISDSLLADQIGIYTAQYTDQNGCKSETSNAISKTVSTPDLKALGLTIYPNPSVGSVRIDNSKNLQIFKLELYDINGKRVNTRIEIQTKSYQIDWSGPSGVYYLKIHSSEGVSTLKLLKSN